MRKHKILGLDTQRIREPRVIVEHSNYLDGVMDLRITPAESS